MNNQVAGFTLLELIIALAIIAIVAVGVVPAVGDILTRNRATTITNEFIGALNYARSEAVMRTRNVTMCRMDSTAGQCTDANFGTAGCVCATGSGATANGWEDGWLTFVDQGVVGTINTAQGDQLLQVQPQLGVGFTVRASSASTSDADNFITFRANGTRVGSDAKLAICGSDSDATSGIARVITIIGTGRARAGALNAESTPSCNL